jgi:glutamate synthase (NADPH) small chain
MIININSAINSINKYSFGARFKKPKPEKNPTNFNTIEANISLQEVQEEAERCLKCKNPPCVQACPIHNPIPLFIKSVAENNIEKAGKILRENQPLPSICGRICFHTCEDACTRGKLKSKEDPTKKQDPIDIGGIERFVGDNTAFPTAVAPETGKKVGIIGSGPAGLAAAKELRKKGHNVIVFDAKPERGGILSYGIPSFRLPSQILDKSMKATDDMGIEFRLNQVVGRDIKGEQLKNENFDAILIASGAGIPRKLSIPGENLTGVYSANDFLKEVRVVKAMGEVDIGPRVIVIGAGNVAMDAARTARRLNCDATVIYRGPENAMKAKLEEIEDTKEEGVDFKYLLKPTEILGTDYVTGVKFEKMVLDEESGKPLGTGEFEIIEADAVIEALGAIPNNRIQNALNTAGIHVENTSKGHTKIKDDSQETNIQGIYAAGDVAPIAASTLTEAIAAGKRAANSIDDYLKSLDNIQDEEITEENIEE